MKALSANARQALRKSLIVTTCMRRFLVYANWLTLLWQLVHIIQRRSYVKGKSNGLDDVGNLPGISSTGPRSGALLVASVILANAALTYSRI